jgi:ubiquinone/menaquinone biosynthesis C-methylase UbiE
LDQAGALSALGGATVLDIGGGAGMHAGFIAQHASHVTTIDIVDPNVTFGGEFLKLLREKYARHGVALDIAKVDFRRADAMELPYKDGLYDLVVSWNAFEHIPDPARALREAVRVTRPAGYTFVTFDPIWTADTGSHFSAFVPEPWAHLTLEQSAFVERMRSAGATEGQVAEFMSAMNKVRLADFERIFAAVEAEGLGKIEFRNSWSGTVDKDSTDHPNYSVARSLGYTERELLTRGLSFVIRRSGRQMDVPASAEAMFPAIGDTPLLERIGGLEAQLSAMLASRSWRITAPLRGLSRVFKTGSRS